MCYPRTTPAASHGADKQKAGHLPDPAQVICNMQQDGPVRALQVPITRQEMVFGRGAEPLRLHVIRCENHQVMIQDVTPDLDHGLQGVGSLVRHGGDVKQRQLHSKNNYPNLIIPARII